MTHPNPSHPGVAVEEDPAPAEAAPRVFGGGNHGGASSFTNTPPMTLKEQILEFVTQHSFATLPQICREFESARGELSFESGNFENVVFWVGLSQEAIDALSELLEEKAIFMHPSSQREYLAGDDWAMLLLPLAIAGRSYASPHWRAVKICAFPPA